MLYKAFYNHEVTHYTTDGVVSMPRIDILVIINHSTHLIIHVAHETRAVRGIAKSRRPHIPCI